MFGLPHAALPCESRFSQGNHNRLIRLKKFLDRPLKVRGKAECTAIECKGKQPGGIVELDEVEKWLSRIPIFHAYLKGEQRFREIRIKFELWATGVFSAEALARLQREKQQRTRTSIDWKDGTAVREMAKEAKEKSIGRALDEHFFKHPLAT